jgi:hypothetical protein
MALLTVFDSYTTGVMAALDSLERFRGARLFLPTSSGEVGHAGWVVGALDASVEAAFPGRASPNAKAAVCLIIRDHFMTEARASLN